MAPDVVNLLASAMLRELHIQNYAVIENLSLVFHAGLNLLSGETGSGKSILVDALGLAVGGRASPDVIRTGQERATVTAVFQADSSPPWRRWFDEYGLAGGSESEIILRREIHSSGRSRLLVNDQPVTVAACRGLAPLLVEVHGQSEQVALLAREAQLDLLDQFADAEQALEKVARLFAIRRELAREMEALSRDEQERLRTIDLLSFQVREIEGAHLVPGEDGRWEEERRVLANLEKIQAAAGSAFGSLYEEDGSACARLVAAQRALEELRRYDATVCAYLEALASARVALEDAAYFLRDYLAKLEANPRRLEELEDRLALIDRLKRKYGHTIEEILAYLERTRQQLANLEHADERRDQIRRELDKVVSEYHNAAAALSELRRDAARKLQKSVREELAQVGMEKTRFEVHFEVFAADLPSAEVGGPRGIDEVEFRISPNPGEDLRPLEKVASGGELSRLMLALKTVVGRARAAGARSRDASGKTFIFDEVDAGIGGRVAESIGQRLKRLARDAQVLCVTHLPQIACFADHHYYVEKSERGGRAVTVVKYLQTEKERALELARMLSGSQITDAVLRHATAMLRQASA